MSAEEQNQPPRFTEQFAQNVLDALGLGSVVQFQVERNPAAAGYIAPPGAVATGGTSNGKVHMLHDSFANTADVFDVVIHACYQLQVRFEAITALRTTSSTTMAE